MSSPYGYVTKTGQFIRKDVLDDYAIKSTPENLSNVLVDDNFTGKYGTYNLIEPRFKPLKLASLLERNTYYESSVYQIAHDIAGSGYDLKKADEKTGDGNIKVLEDFFSRFDVKQVFESAEVDHKSTGYCTIEFVKENKLYTGTPWKLKQIPSHTMRIHRNRQMFMQQVGLKKVYYKAVPVGNDVIDGQFIESDLHKDTGIWYKPGALPVDKRATEVLFFNRYSPLDWFYGVPEIIPAIPALKGDMNRARYNSSFFENYAVPSHAIFITGMDEEDEDDPEQWDQEQNRSKLDIKIEEHFKELQKNPHSTLILKIPSSVGLDGENKVEVKAIPLSVETKEASFMLYRKDNRNEIISKMMIPPYRIGVYETGQLAGNLGEEATKIYRDSKVIPGQTKYNDVINNYILKSCFDIQDVTFSFKALSVDETVQDLTNCGKLVDYASMTPNQMIRFFGSKYGLEESDHPAMDAHYLHGQPVDMELTVPDTLEAQKILDEAVTELIGVAEKSVSVKDGKNTPELLRAIKSLKKSARLGS